MPIRTAPYQRLFSRRPTLPYPKREGDVIEDVHGRVEGVGLKDLSNISPLGQNVSHILVIEKDPTGGNFLYAGDELEDWALA